MRFSVLIIIVLTFRLFGSTTLKYTFNSENMQKLCRLCGKSKRNMIPLVESGDLKKRIFECTTIMVR